MAMEVEDREEPCRRQRREPRQGRRSPERGEFLLDSRGGFKDETSHRAAEPHTLWPRAGWLTTPARGTGSLCMSRPSLFGMGGVLLCGCLWAAIVFWVCVGLWAVKSIILLSSWVSRPHMSKQAPDLDLLEWAAISPTASPSRSLP